MFPSDRSQMQLEREMEQLLQYKDEDKFKTFVNHGWDQFHQQYVYVDGNIRNPALPVMPRQYQNFFD